MKRWRRCLVCVFCGMVDASGGCDAAVTMEDKTWLGEIMKFKVWKTAELKKRFSLKVKGLIWSCVRLVMSYRSGK